MKFLYSFPGRTVPPIAELLTASALSELAVAAERAGYDGVSFDDHPAPPDEWRQDASGHDGLEPFIALAAVAAASIRLRFFVSLCVLPYRNPFLVAKSAATLDVLSQGRLSLGVGTGYLEGEFEALGVDFIQRNELFDESIEVMKLAWTGRPVTYEGLGFTARGNTAQPTPVQQPHPPLWIGGNSKRTLERVAEYGAGWLVMPSASSRAITRHTPRLDSLRDLQQRISMLRAYAHEVDRTDPIEIMYLVRGRSRGSTADLLTFLHELEELGVTAVSFAGLGSTVAEALTMIRRDGDELIGPFRGIRG